MLKRFPVVVDYGQSFEDMVAKGNYNVRDNEVNIFNFPFEDSGVHSADLYLVNIGFIVMAKDIPKCIRNLGFRLASIEYLLAFGAQHQEIQREVFPIVALGDVNFETTRSFKIPYLTTGPFGRCLSVRLSIPEDIWSGNCMFLSLLF